MRSTLVLYALIRCIACFAQRGDTTSQKIVGHFDRVTLNDLLLYLNHKYQAGISFSVDLADDEIHLGTEMITGLDAYVGKSWKNHQG